MRRRIKEVKAEAQTKDSFRVIRGKIEWIMWMLGNMNTSAASGTSVSGSSFSVDTVETLPAIPTVGYQMVFWTSVGAGVGDDQTWEAYAGQSRWYPCQKPTTLSGTP